MIEDTYDFIGRSIIFLSDIEKSNSLSYDDTIKLWGGDGDDWSCLNTLKGHTGTVWQCSFDPTGHSLASCSDDFSVRIWTRAKGAVKHNFAPSHCISGVANQPLYRLP